MKIIQSFLLLAVCLCTTTLMHAQQIKAEVAQPADIKAPAAPTESSKPLPAPVFKPQPAVAAIAPPVAETPSAFKKEDAGKTDNKLKPQAATQVTDVQPVITQTPMQPAHLRQQKN